MTKPDGVLPHPLQPPTPLHIPTHPPLPPPPRTEQPCRPASRSSRWAPWPLLPSAPSKRHGMTTRQAIHAHRIGHPTYPLTPNPACPLLTHSARYSGVPTAGFVTPFRHIALSECPTLSLCQTDLGECDDQEEGGARMHTTLNPNPPYPCHRDSRRRTAVLLARRQGTYCSFSLRPITHQVFEPPPPPQKVARTGAARAASEPMEGQPGQHRQHPSSFANQELGAQERGHGQGPGRRCHEGGK